MKLWLSVSEVCVLRGYVLAGSVGYKSTSICGVLGYLSSLFYRCVLQHHVTSSRFSRVSPSSFFFLLSSSPFPITHPKQRIAHNDQARQYHVIGRLQNPNNWRNCFRRWCSCFCTLVQEVQRVQASQSLAVRA